MARKVILIADPGIDTAFAVGLALHAPNLDVLGLFPTAGNISAEQATANVQILIDQFDPAKWPRTAAAITVTYERDGSEQHGMNGLANIQFPCTNRHQLPQADKAIVDLVRQHPHEITVINLGPATTLMHALVRDPELPIMLNQLIFVGGTYRAPGNVGPMAEFHVWLDPDAARKMIHCFPNLTMIPLDVTRQLVLSPKELLELPNPQSRTCDFLRQVLPFAIRASSNLYGIEGFHLKDVLGVAAAALPGSVTTEMKTVDVETRGELTRGMIVVDDRAVGAKRQNVQLAVGAAIGEIRQWISNILSIAR